MKYFLILVLTFCFCNINAQAKLDIMDKQVAKMSETYNFTASQTAAVKKILINKTADLDKVKREDMSLDEYKRQIALLNQKYDEQMLAVMDEKQKKIFRSHQALQRQSLSNTSDDH